MRPECRRLPANAASNGKQGDRKTPAATQLDRAAWTNRFSLAKAGRISHYRLQQRCHLDHRSLLFQQYHLGGVPDGAGQLGVGVFGAEIAARQRRFETTDAFFDACARSGSLSGVIDTAGRRSYYLIRILAIIPLSS